MNVQDGASIAGRLDSVNLSALPGQGEKKPHCPWAARLI